MVGPLCGISNREYEMKTMQINTPWHHNVGDTIQRGNGATWKVLSTWPTFSNGVRQMGMLVQVF